MISLPFVRFVLLLILVHLNDEISAKETTLTEDRLFRAREAEARRNRSKSLPIRKNSITRFPGIFLENGFQDFLIPELNNDLEQTFILPDFNKQFQICPVTDLPNLTPKKSWRKSVPEDDKKCKTTKLFTPVDLNQPPKDLRDLDTRTRWRVNHEFIIRPTPSTQEEYNDIADSYYCSQRNTPSVKATKNAFQYGTNSSCIMYDVGYEIVPTTDIKGSDKEIRKLLEKTIWKTLYSVCYDHGYFSPVFTKHTLYVPGMYHRKLNRNVNDMKYNSETVGQDIETAYEWDVQKVSLQSQPEGEKLLAAFGKNNYFVRAHLVPEYDMLYESMQEGTHNYLNFAPQWRSINIGQWSKVEQDIRLLASKLGQSITVYTGVVYRPDPIYLGGIMDTKKIPIPAYFFKYIYYEKENAGMVIYTANDVIDEPNYLSIRCENVCVKYDWWYTHVDYQHRNRNTSGKTTCCLPSQFFAPENKIPYPEIKSPDFKNMKVLTSQGQVVYTFYKSELFIEQEEMETQMNFNKGLFVSSNKRKSYLIYEL